MIKALLHGSKAAVASAALLAALQVFGGVARAADIPTLKIGYLPLTHSMAVVVADKLNTGKYRNVKPELVKFSSWPELLDAFNSGKIQAASELMALALAGAERGVPGSVVALSHRHGDILTVAKDVKSVRELKGKRVAIPHRMSVHNILLSQALKKEGLTLKDVQWIEMPPPDMPAALARGDIKGFIVAEPFGTKAIQAGFGKKLLNAKDIWPDYICCALVLNPSFKKKYPAAAKEYIDSFTAAGRFIDANRGEAIRIARQYMNIDEKVFVQSLTHDVTYSDLRLKRGEVEQLQKYALELNLLKKPVNLDSLLDTTFVAAPAKKGKK
ncbi:ABC transporter substrate-binding protein [Geobacter sp. DSM 9736]|uniref:ABC transporter substrate-binding protein n=1 Tax=Geobacter sp. DSM 9736 TaxID=1277350 RepID=UPI000B513F7D|nr:ABC transporter substrate-binding protein [Geobacter sp. DSM 9736]SNB45127.1 NitT/TauT family transport system substrate-binding protein [Geobacter sp. DSM 9736]